MKKLLNTLYVTTQGAYLCHEGESVLVRVDKETKLRVPIHMLGGYRLFRAGCMQPAADGALRAAWCAYQLPHRIREIFGAHSRADIGQRAAATEAIPPC